MHTEIDDLLVPDAREAFPENDFLDDYDFRFEEDDFEALNQNESMDYLNEDRDFMDEPETESISFGNIDWMGELD